MFIALLAAEVAQLGPRVPVVTSLRKPEVSREVRKSAGRVVRAKLTVSPTGKAVRCDVLQESGDRAFDDASCAAFMTSRYSPGADRSGKPAYGIVTVENVYINPREKLEYPAISDLVLAVSRMPQGAATYEVHSAVLTVDATGNAVACDNHGKKEAANALDKLLCTTALKTVHFKPALDEEGKPVPSVQSFSVMFTAQTGPDDKVVVADDNPQRILPPK